MITIRKYLYASIALIGFGCLINPSALYAQQQDTLSRSVTVEKEFQPIIQSAGKLNISPERLTLPEPKVDIVYSNYSAEQEGFINSKPIRFPSKPFPEVKLPDGLLEGSAGYINTYLNFRYRVPVKGKASKGVKLDLYAHHNAEWGVKTQERTTLGLDFVKEFSDLEIYFDVLGRNHFYTRYGRYFDGDNHLSISHFKDFDPSDKQNIWTAAANVGIRSRKNADIQYQVQIGYQAYALPNLVAEHLIRTEGRIEWISEEHHVGADLFVHNMLYSEQEALHQAALRQGIIDDVQQVKSRHGIRIHPYYQYVGERVRAKAGMHLDMNIGKGQMLSSNKQISFAPSPDIEVEYRIIPSWLAVYAGAEGQFGYGSLEEYIARCPYNSIASGVYSNHVSSYVPVDAFLGFKIRATDNLLIDVYARYAYQKNQKVNFIDSLSTTIPYGNINYFYGDYQRWKVGAEITYHYQDIIHILANANYYHWTPEKTDTNLDYLDPNLVYDRPSWDARLRIDARIDKHWSLYSDNFFAGRTNALYKGTIVKTKATIDLNLGARYDFNDALGIYVQLNNFLNRHNDIFYTYQSQGIQGSVGVSWKF